MSRTRNPLAVFASLSGLLVAAAPPQDASEKGVTARIETIAQEAVESIAGLSVVIAVGDEIQLARGWGSLEQGDGRPAGAGSSYCAGSMTELLTAASTLALVDKGKLALTSPVSAYLEGVEWEGERVTLEHLLTHTSGIPGYADFVRLLAPGDKTPAEADVIAWAARQPLEFTPGDCFSYSSTNTLLLGAIVERVAETPLPEFFTQRLFAPLDLEDTAYRAPATAWIEASAGSQEVGGELVDDGVFPEFFRAGDLRSTPRDLARLRTGLLESDVVGSASYERMTTPHRLADGTPTKFAFGLTRTSLNGHTGWSFGGGMGGNRIHVAHYHPFDLTLALAASSEDAALEQLERRLARVVLDLPGPEVEDRALIPEERRVYTGNYAIGCDRIEIVERDERLFFDSVTRPSEQLLYQGGRLFLFASDPEIRVTFQVDSDERARSFTLDERGSGTLAVRFE